MLLYILIITFMLGNSNILALSKDVNYGPKVPLVANGSNIYYFGFIYKGTILQAETFCRNHNMDLISIETPEEHAFIEESLLDYLDLSDQHFTAVWTSGRRYDNGNKWIWEATGRPVHYTNWRSGQPDNANGIENCLELVYLPEIAGQIKWNDSPCNATDRYFICEYNDDNNTPDRSQLNVVS